MPDALDVINPAPVDTAHQTVDGPIVHLRNVHKRFGSLVVLDGVDLAIEAGKTTVILGPSGSGKSVLLKHIVGLLRPDEGEVHFMGQRVDQLSERDFYPIRRQIGYLFQLSALFDSMTVQENLEFPLAEHTDDTAEQRAAKASEALKMVDLAGVESKFPSELSGGQQRRVALARAIMLRPRLILYDEPTTGLDPMRADGISELIIRLQRTLGITGIVVTHDLVLMGKIADRVVMLGGGKIIADGSVSDVRSSSDPHVQNFLTGHYEPESDASSNDRARRAK